MGNQVQEAELIKLPLGNNHMIASSVGVIVTAPRDVGST
jgi:hypothetical protein